MKSAYALSGAAIVLIAAFFWHRKKAALNNEKPPKQPSTPENKPAKPDPISVSDNSRKMSEPKFSILPVRNIKTAVSQPVSQPKTPDSNTSLGETSVSKTSEPDRSSLIVNKSFPLLK